MHQLDLAAVGEPFGAARFRADAVRAMADRRLSPDDLSNALGQVLNDVQSSPEDLRATA